jgi:two-component system chemotaxis sensor kinase CheA
VVNNGKSTPKSPTITPSSGNQQLRVDASRIENVMNLASELVVIKSQLTDSQHSHLFTDASLNATLSQLDKTIRDLYDSSLAMRMSSLKPLFMKMQRTVREVSHAIGKNVELELIGEEVELDRMLIEQLGDPLTHLIRNALDHGLETPSERLQAKKPEVGRIKLKAYKQGNSVIMEMTDDGHGISSEKVLNKAIEKNLVKKEHKLSAAEIHKLIFLPGFSTNEQVTDLSGRGVGMDVVKTNVELMRGQIEIESELGKGTTFRLILPLTTAIADGIIVLLDDQRYVIPMENVREFVKLKPEMINKLEGSKELIEIRGHFYPLVRLRDKLGEMFIPTKASENNLVVMIEYGNESIALVVDDIHSKGQVVLKPLGKCFKGKHLTSSAAVLGDGSVGLVLDANHLIPGNS